MIERSYTFYADRKKVDKRIRDTMSEIDIDYTVALSKFESFPTMADVLGNIVQAVKFRKSKDESGVRVFLKEFGYYATSDPVYIIDGIMTDNTDYFLGLEPSTVSKIGVIRSRSKLSRYGFLGLNGIVVVDTKIANHDLNMPRTERSLRIIKINQAIKFPERVRSNESIPDVRAALYWDPQIAFDGKGKAELSFTTGDATGNFCLKIEGFTADGTPVFYRKNFKVVYEPASK